MIGLPRVEAEVRIQIDKRLRSKGWVVDSDEPNQDVFVERAVIPRLPISQQSGLGEQSPDYTFFVDSVPVAVLEAKKPSVSIRHALAQGRDYANMIGVDLVFACNGPSFKTLHVPTGGPLYLNDVEITEPLGPSRVKMFRDAQTNRVVTIPNLVIKSRNDLITVFERLNGLLRSTGTRAGLDRFTEFANILFLKLLSEKDEKTEHWHELMRRAPEDLPAYINDYLIAHLRKTYDTDLLSETQINGLTLKKIILELNGLRLSDVNEDIKGVAFEHFLRRTTATQNDLGEYFTPRHIVRFMVRLLNPQFRKRVFDPFCGTGGFLVEAFRHLAHQTSMSMDSSDLLHNKSLYGREITTTARIAKMNMILFGDGHSGIVQGDSFDAEARTEYDYVLSNIPFSLKRDNETVTALDPKARDEDEACLLACFNSLCAGGAMAVIVPEGLVVNRGHEKLWQHLCQNSRLRAVLSLPRDSFQPYTGAGTRIIYLTDKGTRSTDWFYDVTLEHGYSESSNSIDMEEFQFFYQDTDSPLSDLPPGVSVATVRELDKTSSFYVERSWKVHPNVETIPLEDIAELRNGTSITQANVTPGKYPVIAGGRGTVPYTHNESNADGNCFTISKSGAYSGYVWWHKDPIWASDSIIVRSCSEDSYLSFYIFLCMKAKQDEIYSRQQGTGQPHVYIQHIKRFPIPKLSLEEQKKYVEYACDATSRYFEAAKERDAAVTDAVSSINTVYQPLGDDSF